MRMRPTPRSSRFARLCAIENLRVDHKRVAKCQNIISTVLVASGGRKASKDQFLKAACCRSDKGIRYAKDAEQP